MSTVTTIGKVVAIRAALRKLAALENERPFSLSGKTRLALVRNFRIAENAGAEFDRTRDALIKQHGKPNDQGGHSIAENTPEHAKFLAEVGALLEQPADLAGCTFVTISASEVADSNAAPIGLLADLITVGILTDGEAEKAAKKKGR